MSRSHFARSQKITIAGGILAMVLVIVLLQLWLITATMEVILDVIEYHMTLADAMRVPRLHHQALPDAIRYESGGLTSAVMDSLKAMISEL